MKRILLIGLVSLMVSCEGGEVTNSDASSWNTINYDGCEYIYRVGIGTRSLVHKGNCKNTIHYRSDTLHTTTYIDSAQVAREYLKLQ
jgi:hypothetical protein